MELSVAAQVEINYSRKALNCKILISHFQRNPPPAKKAKEGDTSKKNASGETYWELDRNRRVTMSNFKGKQYLNIREYYQDKSSGKNPDDSPKS